MFSLVSSEILVKGEAPFSPGLFSKCSLEVEVSNGETPKPCTEADSDCKAKQLYAEAATLTGLAGEPEPGPVSDGSEKSKPESPSSDKDTGAGPNGAVVDPTLNSCSPEPHINHLQDLADLKKSPVGGSSTRVSGEQLSSYRFPDPFEAGKPCSICLGFADSQFREIVETVTREMNKGETRRIHLILKNYNESQPDRQLSVNVTLNGFTDDGIHTLRPAIRLSYAKALKEAGSRALAEGRQAEGSKAAAAAELKCAALAFKEYAIALKLNILTNGGGEKIRDELDAEFKEEDDNINQCKDGDPAAVHNGGSGTELESSKTDAVTDVDSAWRAVTHACYGNAALCQLKLGKFEEALINCHKAIELGPTAKLHYRRGKAYCGCGELALGIKDYGNAIELDPSLKTLITKDIEIAETRLRKENNLIGQRLKKMFL